MHGAGRPNHAPTRQHHATTRPPHGPTRPNHGPARPYHGPARPNQSGGMLVSWNPTGSRADFVVAKDGSATHRSISEALAAVSRMGKSRTNRVIIYIKAGVYNEKIELDRHMKNIMLVGDGMDRTIITNNRNVPDGSSTYGSATFGITDTDILLIFIYIFACSYLLVMSISRGVRRWILGTGHDVREHGRTT